MRAVVSVAGKDHVGVIAKIATTLSDHKVNILDVHQNVLGGDMFAMTMLVELEGCDVSFPALTAELEADGLELNMKVHVMHEDIFNAMHRI
jgi:ACT domain-containing protein